MEMDLKTGSNQSKVDAPVRGAHWAYKLILYGIPVVLLLWVAPFFVVAQSTSCKGACISNLRQIEGAKEQYALEARLGGDSDFRVTEEQIRSYIKGGVPTCPGDGKLDLGTLKTPVTCSLGTDKEHRL